MVNQAERKILDMIEQGQITAEEGLRLIKAMGQDEKPALDTVDETVNAGTGEEVLEPSGFRIPEEEQRRMNRLKRWWVLPFGIGLLITVLGAIWMYSGYMAAGFGWGFWLAWIPFLLGVFIVAISFQSSRSVWLHVRVKQAPGEKPERIAISFPLPLTLSKWVLSSFGHRIPGVRDQPVDNISEILENISPDEPFYVHVEEDDGEEVEVFIG